MEYVPTPLAWIIFILLGALAFFSVHHAAVISKREGVSPHHNAFCMLFAETIVGLGGMGVFFLHLGGAEILSPYPLFRLAVGSYSAAAIALGLSLHIFCYFGRRYGTLSTLKTVTCTLLMVLGLLPLL